MRTLEPRRSQSEVLDPSALRSIRDVERAWRQDVALEIWIDTRSDPVVIRLAGVLDGSTGANLVGVVGDCVAEGRRNFDLDTGSLRIARSGWAVVDRMRAQVHAAGGRLRWDSASIS
jgi:hypothetical protein